MTRKSVDQTYLHKLRNEPVSVQERHRHTSTLILHSRAQVGEPASTHSCPMGILRPNRSFSTRAHPDGAGYTNRGQLNLYRDANQRAFGKRTHRRKFTRRSGSKQSIRIDPDWVPTSRTTPIKDTCY